MKSTALHTQKTVAGKISPTGNQALTAKQTANIEQMAVSPPLSDHTGVVPKTFTILHNNIIWFDWG